MISRSLTFAFALDASSREVRKARTVRVFRIFFGSNSMLSWILRIEILRLRTFSGFESLRKALSRLVRIFLDLAYFAAKDVFKVGQTGLNGREVSVDPLLQIEMDLWYGSVSVYSD